MLKLIRLGLVGSLLIISQFSFAQPDYHIQLKSGSFIPSANIDQPESWAANSSALIDGHYYRIVQFYAIPTPEELQKIEHAGIRLLDYMPLNSYVAAIPSSITPDALNGLNIRSIFDLAAIYKMDVRLNERPLPEHALHGAGLIELQVVVYKNLELHSLLPQLAKEAGTITGVHDLSNTVSLIAPIAAMEQIAALPYVQYVEPVDPPGEPENYTGTTLHRSNSINTSYPGGRKYDGSGVNVQLQDDGIIGPHIDYEGRIGEQFTTRGGVTNDHGDHVAGTIMGAGNLDPRTHGMAPGAMIYVYDYEPFNDSIVPHYQKYGLRITSTSYSNGCNDGYTDVARDHDMEIRLYPELIHVFSAGNNGTANCGYGAGSGWGNVTGGHKQAKNVITVANVDQYDLLASSSSRGPAEDGRIKPDISAKGTAVVSTVPNNNYDSKTGTSMSCPGVSGSLAQLYSAYRQLNGNVNPTSNLIKATVLNTADDLGNVGPDFKFGWGRINNLRAAELLENHWYMIDTISQGDSLTHTLTIPDSLAQVNIMLYWHDYEAVAGASLALVNDLDFTVIDTSNNTHLPWVLDHTPNATNLDAPAVPGVDHLNNMEQVVLKTPDPGTYALSVKGTTVPMGPQPYVIVYEFIRNHETITYPVGGESFQPGENEIIRWDRAGIINPQTLELSLDNGSTWDTVINNLPASANTFLWNVPDTVTGIARMRISESGTSLSSISEPFSIIGSPTNLRIDSACCGTFTLMWDTFPRATSYRVYALGTMYMDSIGETTNIYFQIPVNNSNEEMWVSVASLGPDGALSKRAIAIRKAPGLFNCVKPFNAVLDEIVSPINSTISTCTDLGELPLTIRISAGGLNTLQNIPVLYQVDNGTVVRDTFMGSVSPGNPIQFTASKGITLGGLGTHEIKVWLDLNNDQNRCDDTITTSVNVINMNIVGLPHNEDFENSTTCNIDPNCGAENCVLNSEWLNETNYQNDDIDWRVDQNGTFSSNTGPTIDHKPGTALGNYVYTEASNGCSNATARLLSPCFDLSGTTKPTLRFWYHMFGGNMGSLHLDIFANGAWFSDVWVRSGNRGTAWLEAVIDLTPYAGDTINIRLRGITGSDYQSDMALDDITVYNEVPISASISGVDTACVGESVTFTSQVTPGATDYDWTFGSGANPSVANTAGPVNVVYNTPGLKQVQLIASAGNQSAVAQFPIYIVELPHSQFGINRTGLSITLSNTSTGADAYEWLFGDGTTSIDANPTHTYANSGTYTVRLVSFSQCGSDTSEQSIGAWGVGIEAPPAEIGFSISPNPNDGSFTISIEKPAGKMTLTLFDATGRTVREETVHGSGDAWIKSWDSPGLAKGTYLLQLKSKEKVYKHNIVIQ